MIRPREYNELRVPATEYRQGGRTLYSFIVDGKRLPEFATISRVHRDDNLRMQGYQRPEVLSHIAEIRTYLESERPLIPNSIVVAFNTPVRFEPLPEQPVEFADSRLGVICIPLDPDLPAAEKPAWIVDGQQRAAAIREANVERFPIAVNAFFVADAQEQKEQFILVNSTKPLPKGLLYELLPGTEARLPAALQRRRFPALLLERLNFDGDSPFHGLIQTPTNPEGIVKDNSVLRMLENSLTEGALHQFRNPRTGEGDQEAMLELVKAYWSAVRVVFEDAWAQPPRQSRLMHGAGIVSMGMLMDAIAERYVDDGVPSAAAFREDLLPLQHLCKWTGGAWDFGPGLQRRWNEVQNTSKDITLLADYLLGEYRERVWKVALRSQVAN
jgi:DGQHR domain-containing protein